MPNSYRVLAIWKAGSCTFTHINSSNPPNSLMEVMWQPYSDQLPVTDGTCWHKEVTSLVHVNTVLRWQVQDSNSGLLTLKIMLSRELSVILILLSTPEFQNSPAEQGNIIERSVPMVAFRGSKHLDALGGFQKKMVLFELYSVGRNTEHLSWPKALPINRQEDVNIQGQLCLLTAQPLFLPETSLQLLPPRAFTFSTFLSIHCSKDSNKAEK